MQTLCDALGVLGGTWNQNGDILLGGLGRVQRVPAGGGPAADLPGREAVTEVYPVFLPDGRHYLATRAGNPGSSQAGIWLSSIDGNGSLRLLPDYSNAAIVPAPPGSEAGQVLFTREGTLMALPFDMKQLEPAGDAFVVAQRIAGGAKPYWLAAASSGGLLAHASGQGGGRQYVWRDRQGRNLGAIGDAGNVVMISPNGKELTGDRGQDICVLEFAGGHATRLTFAPPANFNPIWSPDGRYVAYGRFGRGIYRKPSNGARAEELLIRVNGLAVPKSWSPDGVPRYEPFKEVCG